MTHAHPVHSIEAESYRLLDGRVDLRHLPPGARAVVARVVHATADVDFAESMVVGAEAVTAGLDALRRGAPVVADVEMVRAGITGAEVRCYLGQVAGEAPGPLTRSAAAMRLAAHAHPQGAIVVVGCAPTALAEVVRLARAEGFRPALVVGLPVGFVGAAEAKADLRACGLSAISNLGEKGGSGAAAAVVNALVRLAG